MRPAVRILLVAAAVAAALTCGNDGVAPVAGELKVNLTTPNTGDGAILISVAGPAALTNPYTLYVVRTPQPHPAARAFAAWATAAGRTRLLTLRLTDGTAAFAPREGACTAPR